MARIRVGQPITIHLHLKVIGGNFLAITHIATVKIRRNCYSVEVKGFLLRVHIIVRFFFVWQTYCGVFPRRQILLLQRANFFPAFVQLSD